MEIDLVEPDPHALRIPHGVREEGVGPVCRRAQLDSECRIESVGLSRIESVGFRECRVESVGFRECRIESVGFRECRVQFPGGGRTCRRV